MRKLIATIQRWHIAADQEFLKCMWATDVESMKQDVFLRVWLQLSELIFRKKSHAGNEIIHTLIYTKHVFVDFVD